MEVIELKHPLVEHKLAILREKEQEIRRQKIRAKREARKKQEQKNLER